MQPQTSTPKEQPPELTITEEQEFEGEEHSGHGRECSSRGETESIQIPSKRRDTSTRNSSNKSAFEIHIYIYIQTVHINK